MAKAVKLDPPLFVLSIEGLGSALGGTRPASIVRWVAPLANKPKPPPRAKLVAARPLVFGFALPRRACIGFDEAVTWSNEARALMSIGFFVLVRKLCARNQAFSSLPNAGSAHRAEPAPNHCGRALTANGRAACACTGTTASCIQLRGGCALACACICILAMPNV